jgi:hypothetical protein
MDHGINQRYMFIEKAFKTAGVAYIKFFKDRPCPGYLLYPVKHFMFRIGKVIGNKQPVSFLISSTAVCEPIYPVPPVQELFSLSNQF